MRKKEAFPLFLAALSAFCVYTCMFAYRKPVTAATFSGLQVWAVDYKVWLVIAQTIGYMLSKFYGIRFIGALQPEKRFRFVLLFIGLAWMALFFFALVPAPYNLIFLVINGFPLGMIYGIVLSFLEGRRSTELLGAVLASSFIFASGFTQSIGKAILLNWNVNEWWMPFVTGALFLAPLVFFNWLLRKTPLPSAADMNSRTERVAMSKAERSSFVRKFFPGLFLLVVSYVLLTILRDYRSNFASNIWNELGYGQNAAVFTQSEIPASLITLFLLGLLVFVKNNLKAFLINHVIIVAGFALSLVTTLLYQKGVFSPFWFMTITGVGLYMGYVPFNVMLFERLIASARLMSNAGFLIYLADSFGYLGSSSILMIKGFAKLTISWSSFFVTLMLVFSVAGMLLVCFSWLYFRKKLSPSAAGVNLVSDV
jgi:MFS family permease